MRRFWIPGVEGPILPPGDQNEKDITPDYLKKKITNIAQK